MSHRRLHRATPGIEFLRHAAMSHPVYMDVRRLNGRWEPRGLP
jgi:hypothetical protein